MKTKDFDFYLPENLIAQTPATPRDASRLLIAPRGGGAFEHRKFSDLTEYLRKGDCLVLNDSRVMPARIFSSDGKIEVLLLRRVGGDSWECLTRPGKKTRENAVIEFGGGITATVVELLDDGVRVLRFSGGLPDGEMPLPPYIHEKLTDRERYQTVYSKELGSAAAPTAGLHFTPELLDRVKAIGVTVKFITLHVGLGTFRPVKVEDITDHKMHREYFWIPEDTRGAVRETKDRGGRVIAVGTTACRALESGDTRGSTDIFITPGYEFKIVDALVTNFHLPQSTLIMLVSALLGRERTLEAYKLAVDEGYRFFSFGDAMFIS
ncbi:S-adenosylmethionine:tRNA ribosyltransferase-isomerase [Clostridia bacterium]|nr:S-adenosylmethionine:tRNA ribosyltransferase-isomerase [Clostridia bacterium]